MCLPEHPETVSRDSRHVKQQTKSGLTLEKRQNWMAAQCTEHLWFESLKSQEHHFDYIYQGIEKKEPDEKQTSAMKHGKNNEHSYYNWQCLLWTIN